MRRKPEVSTQRSLNPATRQSILIKTMTLPEGCSTEQARAFHESFLKDAGLAENLSHPGIVPLQEYGGGGEQEPPFIVVEHVAGPNLRELIDAEGPLNASWSMSVIATLADAVDAIHQAGLRDLPLEPENILIAEKDGTARITDLGLGQSFAGTDSPDTDEPLDASAYTAPERLLNAPSGIQAGLFGLAVILYEMLCNQRPFGGWDPASIRDSILHDDFTPPSKRFDELSPDVDAFFARALAKDPDDRFPDATGFKQELEALICATVPAEDDEATASIALAVDTAAPIVESTPTDTPGAYEPSAAVESVGASDEMGRASATPPRGSRWLLILLFVVGAIAIGWLLVTTIGSISLPGSGARSTVPSTGRSTAPRPAAVPAAPVAETVDAGGDYDTLEGTSMAPEPIAEPATPAETAEAPTPTPKPVAQPVAEKKMPPKPAVVEKAPVAKTPPADPVPAVRTEPVAEPVPAVPLPEPASLAVVVKSGIKRGTFTLLVDGYETYAAEFANDDKRMSRLVKKATGKGLQNLETTLELPPGRHIIVARVYNAAKDREIEKSLDVELEPGDSKSLRIVTGRTLGRRLTLKLE